MMEKMLEHPMRLTVIDDYNSDEPRNYYLRVVVFTSGMYDSVIVLQAPWIQRLSAGNETTHKKGYGKTRNLIDGTVPLGVIRCEINKG